MPYTLKQFFEEAKVAEFPDWFGDIVLRHRKIENFKPRWEQVEGLNMGFAFPNLRCALFDEQGTGKTLPAQAYAIWQAATGNKIVCLMPRTLLRQFEASLFFTFQGIHDHIRCEIYHDTPKKRDKTVGRWSAYGAPDIVLTTYGMFMREFKLFHLFDFRALLMDEAKILSNPDSSTTTAIQDFMGEPGERYAMVLNGTPAGNTLLDLYGNITFLTPHVYAGKRQFENRHIEYKEISVKIRGAASLGGEKFRNVDVIEDYKNLDNLIDNLYLQARRVEKSSLNLPPLTEDVVPFDLSEEHKEAYDKFVTERLLEFNDGSILDGTTSSGLRMSALQSVIRPDILGLKEESRLLELVEELMLDAGIVRGGLGSTKVFLMAHFQKTVELLKERFKKYKPAVIYGKTKNPQQEKEKFLYEEECRVLIINYESGGVGLDGLQDVCYTGICVEPTTVPRAYAQARDRLHRCGQSNPVQIYFPKPRGTLYVKAINDLRKKQDWVDLVVSCKEFKDELLGLNDEDE